MDQTKTSKVHGIRRLVAERRSTRSPGCSEAEPWVNGHHIFYSPERAKSGAGINIALSGL